MEDRQADLLVGTNGGDRSRVQELSTLISAGLNHFDRVEGVIQDAREADW